MTATISEKANTGTMAGKYLTFRLEPETYGISVLKVREIIQQININSVPQMPAFIKGVINLRGKIIPVVDLRAKFGLKNGNDSLHSCIVVVQVSRSGNNLLSMGIMVDDVEEVVNIIAQDIETVPDFGVNINTSFILGMAKIKGSIKTLLDIDRVLTAETVELIANDSLDKRI